MSSFGARQLRHSGAVNAVIALPGGRVASASTSADETVVWDVESGKRLLALGECAGDLAFVAEDEALVLAFARVSVARLTDGALSSPGVLSELKWPMATGGQRIAAFREEGTRVVVASLAGAELAVLPMDEKPQELALSPDARMLAVARAAAGMAVFRVHDGVRALADASPTDAVTFGRGGQLLSGGDGHVTLRDAQFAVLWRQGTAGRVHAVAIDPSERLGAAQDWWGAVTVFTMKDGRTVGEWKVDRTEPTLAFLDERTVACARANAVRVVDARSGELRSPQVGHEADITGAAAAGGVVVTSSIDHTARVWDVRDGRQLHRLEHDNAVEGVALSADGTLLASTSADGWVRLFRLPSGEPAGKLENRGSIDDEAIALSPSGKTLACDVRGGMAIISVADRGIQHTLSSTGSARAAFIDEARLVWRDERTLSVIDAHDGRKLRTEVAQFEGPLAVSPDGHFAATREKDRVTLYGLNGLGSRREIEVHLPVAFAFSDQGVLAIAAFNQEQVLFHDVSAGAMLPPVVVDGRPSALVFLDQRQVFVGYRDGTAETVEAPLTLGQADAAIARQRTERFERLQALLRDLSLQSAAGYRDAPRRELLDADGRGITLPTPPPLRVALRCAVDDERYTLEIRAAMSEVAAAPPGAFERLGRWLRARLTGAPPPAADPRDAPYVAALRAATGAEPRAHRIDATTVTVTLDARVLPSADALLPMLDRARELVTPPPMRG